MFSINHKEISMKILWPIILFTLILSTHAHADSWSAPEYFLEVETAAWNSDSTLVQVWCRKTIGGSAPLYTYRYNWSSAGHSIETAKSIYSTILTVQSTGRRMDLFGDHNGTGVWNNFSSIKIKE
jgi:hypothetical protein